jgi:long-chain acyl-CoA synthetase
MGQMGYEGFSEVEGCTQFYMIMPDPKLPSPILGTDTLANLMKDQSPKFESVPTKAEDVAIIIYTSGTTGNPKGAMLTHANLLVNAVISAGLVDTSHKDTQLIVLPLFHIFAMTVLMNEGLYRGVHSILLPRYDPEAVLGLMQKHEVTIFAGVPTMYWGLVHYENKKFDLKKISSKLRICASGGASLPEQVLKDFEEKFNVPIIEGYGMSEGSPVVTFNHLDIGRKVGSIGTPVWGVEVKLVDEEGEEVPIGEKGELLYKGHNVM